MDELGNIYEQVLCAMPAEVREQLAELSAISQAERNSREVERLNATSPADEWKDTSGYHCEKCNNKSVLYYLDDNDEIKVRRCDCIIPRRSYKRLKESGLYRQAESKTFKNFDRTTEAQADMYELAGKYVRHILDDDGTDWLYIGGQSGCGKTHLCTAAAVALIKRGYDVGYMLWKGHGDTLKATVGKDPERYEEIIRPFLDCDILYIDDFLKTGHSADGKMQEPTTGDINLAIKLIFTRSEAQKPTIISCEYTLNRLLEIDEATGGRIVENAANFNMFVPYGEENNYRYKFING